jgi:hypothetical protein
MSYTEYMRRKTAGQPVVINNQKIRTASELTQERRLLAASVFNLDGSSQGTTRGDLRLTETAVNPQRPISSTKRTGRPAAASDFTAYVGSHVIQNDVVFPNASKTTNPAACTTNSDAKIAEPSPYITGTTAAVEPKTVPRSASDYIRERLACQQVQGEQHVASELGPSVFVDDTIRKPEYNKQYLSGATSCEPNVKFPMVEHSHPLTTPRTQTGVLPRPTKSQIPVFNVPSQDYPLPTAGSLPNCFTGENTTGVFSRGGILPKDALRYVENHHGNDLSTMVNGRKPVPAKYQIPRGTPAQLKINDPFGPRTPNM